MFFHRFLSLVKNGILERLLHRHDQDADADLYSLAHTPASHAFLLLPLELEDIDSESI